MGAQDRRDCGRRVQRFDCRLEARYELFTGAERHQLSETRQVARNGCMLLAGGGGSHREIEGTKLFVHLKLPSGDKVKLLGTIVWTRLAVHGLDGTMREPGTFGVQFDPSQPLPDTYLGLLGALEALARKERPAITTAAPARPAPAPAPREPAPPSRPCAPPPAVVTRSVAPCPAPVPPSAPVGVRARAFAEQVRERRSSAPPPPPGQPSTDDLLKEFLAHADPQPDAPSRPTPSPEVDALLREFVSS